MGLAKLLFSTLCGLISDKMAMARTEGTVAFLPQLQHLPISSQQKSSTSEGFCVAIRRSMNVFISYCCWKAFACYQAQHLYSFLTLEANPFESSLLRCQCLLVCYSHIYHLWWTSFPNEMMAQNRRPSKGLNHWREQMALTSSQL